MAQTPARQSAISSIRTAPLCSPLGSCCASSSRPRMSWMWWPYSCATTYSWASGPLLEPNCSLEDVEEARVDVDLLVERAVERARPGCSRCRRPTGSSRCRGSSWPGCTRACTSAARCAQKALTRVHGGDDAALRRLGWRRRRSCSWRRRCRPRCRPARTWPWSTLPPPGSVGRSPGLMPKISAMISRMMPPMPPPTTMPPGAPPPPPRPDLGGVELASSLKLIWPPRSGGRRCPVRCPGGNRAS